MATTQDNRSEQPDKPPFPLSNMALRTLTAIVTMPVLMFSIHFGGWMFAGLACLVAGFSILEFMLLAKGRQSQGSALIGVPAGVLIVVGVHLGIPALWVSAIVAGFLLTLALEIARHPNNFRLSLIQSAITLLALVYIAVPAAMLVDLRNRNVLWVVLILCITIGSDTAAYFGGRAFGKVPLAPRLSPKKTREGAIAGIIGGFIPALVVLMIGDVVSPLTVLMIAVGPMVAIAGDLLESAIKRYFQAKDSHVGINLFPGHGGVLDRADSLLLVTPFCYGMLWLAGLLI